MRWRFLILAGALLAVYGAGLFLRFGFYDDYYALNWAVNGSDKLLLFCAAQGRPLDGLIADLAFKIPHTVDGLVWLRMTTLVGLGAFAWTIGKSLTRAGWPAAHALCVSIIVATLPAAQVYAAWSIEIAKPWAGVLAGCAACLAARSLDLHRGEAGLRTLSFAAALLFAAFTIYQPGAMIFFVFVAIDIFRPIAPASPWRRRLGTFAAVAFVALAGEWILFRVASRWINPAQFPGASIVERARTISPAGLLHKLAFFVRAPLNESLRGPALPLPWQGSVAIGAMIGIGLLLYFPGRPMARLRYLAVAAALLPMTFACNLLTVEDAAAYRMQVAMECLVAVYALFAMQGWWRAASGMVGRRTQAAGKIPTSIAMVPAVFPAALALVSCVLANRYFSAYLAAPQAIEWSAVGAMVRGLDGNGVNRVAVIRIDAVAPIFAPAHMREFGLPTSTRDFAAADLVEDAIRQLRPDMEQTPVYLASGAQVAAAAWAPTTAVIDLRRLQWMGASVYP